MSNNPSYEELAQKVRDLEREATLLKEAKRTGEESEEAYRLVVENAPDGIGIIQGGTIQFSNPALNHFIGFSQEGLQGRPFFELIHPDDREMVSEYYHKRLSGKEVPFGYSFKAVDRNGAVKWIEVKPVIGSWKGKPATITFLSDITLRKEAEELLRNSEATLTAILDASPIGIGLLRNRKMAWGNRGMYNLLGYEVGSLEGTSLRMLYSNDEEYEGVGRDLYAEVREKGVRETETQLVRKDGKGILCHLRASPLDPSDLDKGTIVTVMDITDQRHAMDILRESEEKYRTLLETANDAIFVADVETGTILDANKKARDLVGLSPESIIGMHLSKFYPKEASERYEEIFQEHIRRGGSISSDLLVCSSDGTQIPVEIRSGISEIKGKKVIQGILRDISDRKRAEEQIHSLTQQLMMSSENERQMISRELHDQTAQALSAAKIIIDRMVYSQGETALSEMRGELSEISRVIQGVIAAVRDLAHDLRPPLLENMGFVRAISKHCEEFAERTGLGVDLSLAGLDTVELNFEMEINLYRLIQEGLNNIRHHAQANRATIKMVRAYPNIILRIEDDGKGFDVEKRMAKMVKEKRMGLWSMEERARLLGGYMKIDSKPGEGTRILAKIPCTERNGGRGENHIDH